MSLKTKTPTKRSKTSETQTLPPCKVCGGEAVGFHFGVNTCAACKSFFKRMVKKPPPTQACEGKCEAQPGKAQCMFCRYNRCLQAGMSTTAAKRGRYSQHTKVENMIAAQTAKQAPQPTAPVVQRKPTSTESLVFTSSGEESCSPKTKVILEGVTDSPDSGNYSSDMNIDYEVPSPGNFDDFNACGGSTELNDIEVTEMMPVDLSIPPSCRRSNVAPDQLESLTEFMERLFNQYAVVNSEQIALDLRTRYKEERNLRTELFGSLKPVEWSEYKRIYEETGLDIDGRREMFENCMKGAEKLGERYISFCQDIPGFKDLPLEDQNGVIMNNHFLFAVMMDCPYINVEEKIYASPLKDYTFGEDEMLLYFTSDDIVIFFDLIKRLQSFHFTTKEQALVTAALLLWSENGRTESGKKHLEHAQNVLLDALQLQYSKTHPNCPSVMAQTVAVVHALRTNCLHMFHLANEKKQQTMKDLSNPGQTIQQIPDMHEVPKDRAASIEDTLLMKMLKMTDPTSVNQRKDESKD